MRVPLRQPNDAPPVACVEDLVQRLAAIESALEFQSEACRQIAQQLIQVTKSCPEQTTDSESLNSAMCHSFPAPSSPLLTPQSQCLDGNIVSSQTRKKLPVRDRIRRALTVNDDDMIEQVKDSLTEDSHNVAHYYETRGIFQKIARSEIFDAITLIVILVSLLWIAVDIDSSEHTKAQPIFKVAEHGFLMFFIAELLVRFMAFKEKRNWLSDFWCVFDTGVVLLMILELFVTASSVGSIKILRVFRLCRLVRMVRVLKYVPEVMIMLKGIVIALRAIGVVGMLLSVIIYVSAVSFRIMFDGTKLGTNRFSSVMASMSTLLLDCTLSGQKGVPIIRAAYHEGVVYALLMLVYVVLCGITVMGVLTGLLVQTVKTVADLEKEQQTICKMKEHMEDLWRCLSVRDATGKEYISMNQLQQISGNEHVNQMLIQMDVDLDSLHNVKTFLLEQHGDSMSLPQFKRMLLDLRGKNLATVKDHVETRKLITEQFRKGGLFLQRSGGSMSMPPAALAPI